jgi:ubiquinone/menaquinone biosynthesis C-methylase UbiE
MSALAQRLKEKYFGNVPHPYAILEREVAARLRPGDTLLDAGCGRTAPVLVKMKDRAQRLVGVDLVDFRCPEPGIELLKTDLARIPIEDASVDLAMSRSVLEHLDDPIAVYREMHRVLKPGGRFVFLTANRWDYASLAATVIPNRFHGWIVRRTEGRMEEDTFPVRYRTNSRRAISRLAKTAGFEIADFRYLGQYPNYFMFNGVLFFLATGYEKLLARFDALAPLRGWIFATLVKPALPTG